VHLRGPVSRFVAGLLLAFVPALALAQESMRPAAAQDGPIISDIRIDGVTVYTPAELERRYGLERGARLKLAPGELATEIQKRYVSDGYLFARVSAALEEDGVLAIHVDEGEIDEIEFRGVGAQVTDRVRAEFALHPGDVFNAPQAQRALDAALAAAQGAVEPVYGGRTFDMRREGNRRVLEVNLRLRSNRSGPFVGTQGREDWYSPVDGFNPAIGFQSTIFDPERFNHAYWAGYFSYKFARKEPGYTFGLERPFFADGVLQVGASIHDLTGSDDRWRLQDVEQSLVAFAFRNSFRDYHRRKGWQAYAAVRPFAQHEWLALWRSESHGALANETSYGVFRDDHPFRANAVAQEGRLHALVLGYTFDSRGLTEESIGERYRRHQVDDFFGSTAGRDTGARIEWRSELAPAAFDHDFDFSRHVLTARAWIGTSPQRTLTGRAIAGFSDGALPTQRLFGLGGVGSVHGYAFKEAVGEGMLLLNGEFLQRFGRSGIAGIAFIDSGRVSRPIAGSSDRWLNGVGLGIELGGSRVEFGWRLDDIPSSLQVLFRLGPTW
jgi:hypothetical protein